MQVTVNTFEIEVTLSKDHSAHGDECKTFVPVIYGSSALTIKNFNGHCGFSGLLEDILCKLIELDKAHHMGFVPFDLANRRVGYEWCEDDYTCLDSGYITNYMK